MKLEERTRREEEENRYLREGKQGGGEYRAWNSKAEDRRKGGRYVEKQ